MRPNSPTFESNKLQLQLLTLSKESNGKICRAGNI